MVGGGLWWFVVFVPNVWQCRRHLTLVVAVDRSCVYGLMCTISYLAAMTWCSGLCGRLCSIRASAKARIHECMPCTLAAVVNKIDCVEGALQKGLFGCAVHPFVALLAKLLS